MHSEAVPECDSETEKVTSAEFNMTLKFIQGGGALRMLRVLSKLCDEPTYIKMCNWLVFNAKSSACMELCYLILSMLTAQPKFAGIMDQKHEGLGKTATTSSTANPRHTREERLGRCAHIHEFDMFVCACTHVVHVPIDKSIFMSIPMFPMYVDLSVHISLCACLCACLCTCLYTCLSHVCVCPYT